jgi:cytochrome P450/NADPH-cytochrome P450 reductase
LPTGRPITTFGLLSGYVELSQPATPRNLRDLVASSKSEAATQVLHHLTETYAQEVLAKRVSLLDILEANPDIQPTFAQYLEMLPPIRVRQYSISSSPLWNPQRVALTISVVKAPALSGRHDEFMGVATTYLDGLRPGDKVQMAARRSGAFHLPPDPSVPIVMIAAGSGVAPMRGFIQERALQKEAGRDVGKATLFFGCRSPDDDFLYSKTDLEAWTKLGILEVRPAFSRDDGKSEGCKYVQEYVIRLSCAGAVLFIRELGSRVWKDREIISERFSEGAIVRFLHRARSGPC